MPIRPRLSGVGGDSSGGVPNGNAPFIASVGLGPVRGGMSGDYAVVNSK